MTGIATMAMEEGILGDVETKRILTTDSGPSSTFNTFCHSAFDLWATISGKQLRSCLVALTDELLS